jgi:hypothetical protein
MQGVNLKKSNLTIPFAQQLPLTVRASIKSSGSFEQKYYSIHDRINPETYTRNNL